MLTNCKVIGANVPMEVYVRQSPGVGRGHGDYVMSRSELMKFAVNPAKWKKGKADDGTSATEWGALMDCLLTCPEKFDSLFAVTPETYPDTKTGEPKPWTFAANFCKAWREEHEGKTIVKSADRLEADTALAEIKDCPDVWELFQCSKKQVMVVGFWKDKETKIKVPLRALLDLVPDKNHAAWGKTIGDSKTARNGNPAQWPRVCDDSGYDIQAALYADMFTAATGEDRTDFVFAVQENEPPYHVVTPIPAMSVEFLAYGRLKYQNALAYYAQCLARNVWPGYQPTGLVFGATQILGPESLYSYAKTGGQGKLQDYFPAQDEQAKPKFVSQDPT